MQIAATYILCVICQDASMQWQHLHCDRYAQISLLAWYAADADGGILSCFLVYVSYYQTFVIFSDASKATFTASPSSCFLANRNKTAPIASDASVKNECLMEQTYFSLSSGHHSSLSSGLNPCSAGDSENMQPTGRKQRRCLLLISSFLSCQMAS